VPLPTRCCTPPQLIRGAATPVIVTGPRVVRADVGLPRTPVAIVLLGQSCGGRPDQPQPLAAIRSSRRYAVHLLDARQESLAVRFATPGLDRFADTGWRWDDGLPVLAGVLARFECDLAADIEIGDHTIVLGTVVQAATDTTKSPLVHQDRGFHQLRRAAP
jgi:hypothetical protein